MFAVTILPSVEGPLPWIPVWVHRQVDGLLRVGAPEPDLLRNRFWELRVHLTGDTVLNGRTKDIRRLLAFLEKTYGQVDLLTDFRVGDRCHVACVEANPDTVSKCECRCGGSTHGGLNGWDNWTELSSGVLIGNHVERTHYKISPGSETPHRRALARLLSGKVSA